MVPFNHSTKNAVFDSDVQCSCSRLSPSIMITADFPCLTQFFTGRMPFLPPNQQRRSTEGKTEWWGAGMAVYLGQGADLHMAQLMPLPLTISCFSKSRLVLTFLVLAYRGCPGKKAVKRM